MPRSCRHLRCKSRDRRGVAAVEFALAAPVLFLMLFGIVEFGRVLLVQNALTNAVREGARRAVMATTQNVNDVEGLVVNELASVVSAANADVNVSPNDLSAIESGTEITVNVSVTYADISWLPVSHLVGGAELTAHSTQVRE